MIHYNLIVIGHDQEDEHGFIFDQFAEVDGWYKKLTAFYRKNMSQL